MPLTRTPVECDTCGCVFHRADGGFPYTGCPTCRRTRSSRLCQACGQTLGRWRTPPRGAKPKDGSRRTLERRSDAWLCPSCDAPGALTLTSMGAHLDEVDAYLVANYVPQDGVCFSTAALDVERGRWERGSD